MRLPILSFTGVSILLGTPGEASPLVCPPGTQARELRSSGVLLEWCERPDGTHHGPSRTYTQTPWRKLRDGEQATMQLQQDCTYVEEQSRETCTGYSDGKKQIAGVYVNDLEVGVWRRWDDAGRVISEGTYRAGKRTGEWLVGFDVGDKARGTYCAGKRCGRWTLFISGVRAAQGEYRNDVAEGLWTHWEGGVLRARGTYVHGKKSGTWTYWNVEHRRKESELTCRDGKPHGVRRAWWPHRLVASYRDGELDGVSREENEDGVFVTGTYEHGSHVDGARIDEPDAGAMAVDGDTGRRECEPEGELELLDSFP
jgi:antitoxin component YwqK of YwqJK toxin-antitoxin module